MVVIPTLNNQQPLGILILMFFKVSNATLAMISFLKIS